MASINPQRIFGFDRRQDLRAQVVSGQARAERITQVSSRQRMEGRSNRGETPSAQCMGDSTVRICDA
ncbi:hypothetical protein E5D57_003089 [Metarhizium anisopliae]|nr:hypothetical protein E5D57_003089 [Metarhizium anisopliae]